MQPSNAEIYGYITYDLDSDMRDGNMIVEA